MTVGEFLMKMIFWEGMSLKESAEQIGIAPPWINDIIKGKRKVNTDIAQRLEKTFGVPAIVWVSWQAVDELNKN